MSPLGLSYSLNLRLPPAAPALLLHLIRAHPRSASGAAWENLRTVIGRDEAIMKDRLVA